ncbi:cytochrome P460 family protein [Halochromatium sp.]
MTRSKTTQYLIALTALLAAATTTAEPQAETQQGDTSVMPTDLDGYRFINAVAIDDPDDPLHGFHHFYLNEAGMQAFREGGPYPVGTEFVGLVYEITRDGPIRNEGDGKAIALMEKVEGAEETGGWRFALLGPDGSAMEIDPAKDCFECHTQVRERDFVFSQPHHVGELGWTTTKGQ